MAKQTTFSYYRSHVSQRHEPAIRRRRLPLLFLVLVICLVVVLKVSLPHNTHAHAEEKQPAVSTAHEAAVTATVQQVMNANPSVTFGVSVVDVDSGKALNLGTQTPFIAASTGKLLTAALYLHEVGLKQASLSHHVAGDSAQDWLRQMIVYSDNTAWENLNTYLTHPALAAYAESIGIHDYDVTDNMLAPHDTALLLDKLANGSLLKPVQTSLLLGYMKIANYRDSIVPAVPPEDTVYHKIGFLDDYLHDAAIIQNPAGRRVVLVIYTNGNGTYDDDTRNAAMQAITRAVIQNYL